MSRDDYYASPFGAAFSAYMERPRLSWAIAQVFWGANVTPYYESMAAVGDVPDGGTIADCPCGAGPALRALSPEQDVRYVAADLSPSMLRRINKRIDKRGLRQVEALQADATEIPLPDDSADLFLSYWGCTASPTRRRRSPRRPASSSPADASSAPPSSADTTACGSDS